MPLAGVSGGWLTIVYGAFGSAGGGAWKLISEARRIKHKERLVAALSGYPAISLGLNVMLLKDDTTQHP